MVKPNESLGATRFGWRGLKAASVVLCLLSVWGSASTRKESEAASPTVQSVNARTVTRSEIGLIFAYPNAFSWKSVGAYVGVANSGYFAQMSPGALKIQHGRAQHFQPADDEGYSFFPYSELKQYEAQEIAAGRSPIFITATYEGKKRPVYFSWSLGLRGNVPSAPREQWMQAVSVNSDRFIHFWVDRYVRAILWHNRLDTSDRWVGIDNCAFRLDLYGVIDNGGHFVAGVTWDSPFAQGSDQYLLSIKQFFHKLKQVAPDIKTMCNVGSLEDWSQFQSVYADVPGLMAEDISDADPREFARKGQYDDFTAFSWFGSQGRVAVLRAIVPRNAADKLRTAYMIYLLVKGPNFFFAPEFDDSAASVPPAEYAEMNSALGDPTELMRIAPARSKGSPYNLYARTFQRGTVYVNWTGATLKIALPGDRHYYDATGNSITVLTVPDLTGTYVTTEQPKHARISSSTVSVQ